MGALYILISVIISDVTILVHCLVFLLISTMCAVGGGGGGPGHAQIKSSHRPVILIIFQLYIALFESVVYFIICPL